MTCDSSCPALHPQTNYMWYWDMQLRNDCESQHLTVFDSVNNIVSCALKGHDELYSDKLCEYETIYPVHEPF